ncbi:MAG: hypothetical protein E6Q40_11420 [Cupriavidus sp.]|nr:MAG: hypothetical protein E6Q40_11420 [Cupriavidus sp.]
MAKLLHAMQHIVAATIWFLVILAAALMLGWAVHGAELLGLNAVLVWVFKALESVVVVCDVVCFIAHLVKTVLASFRDE